ncbi:MAG: superoxide dismutase [Rhodospirillales bacterium]|nr:superoxide dismutase [Rhodospirillales bacterium]
MQVILPQLPYAYDALEPHISRSTLEIHHGKHHRAYVEKARTLAAQVRLADQPLERIILQTAGQDRHRALFNNAAQAWNHAFYWRSLRPGGGGEPRGEIAERVKTGLGDSFVERFAAAATGQFGSGWAWLVLDGDRLEITTTSNADTPLAHGQTPLLAIDVWEHAYYLDYQNRRADYAAAVIQHLLNWDFANRNLSRRQSAARAGESRAERGPAQPSL